ncbi:MAG: hypothetical protein KBT53_04210 [Porticoccus sp.]|nr:hypothetical protein [Porticoccus sp.]MBQ0806918.1 hypothetical protein [Porticoccus sp.]MDX2350171.1 hypothetical protein [Porticoccus sp.]
MPRLRGRVLFGHQVADISLVASLHTGHNSFIHQLNLMPACFNSGHQNSVLPSVNAALDVSQ